MSENLFNTLLFFGTVLLYCGGVGAAYWFFGKIGLYIWTALSAVIANIEALVQCNMFGLELTLGNAIYASSFLVTDILSEKYDKKSAQKAVYIGLFTAFIWVAATQMITLFTPNANDFIMPHLQKVFHVLPRIALASVFTYAVSQTLDIHLYHLWWKLTGKTERFLWLRNNGSTLISQLTDTIVFTLIAFAGLFPWQYIFTLCWTTYMVKALVALFDTPFLYLTTTTILIFINYIV